MFEIVLNNLDEFALEEDTPWPTDHKFHDLRSEQFVVLGFREAVGDALVGSAVCFSMEELGNRGNGYFLDTTEWGRRGTFETNTFDFPYDQNAPNECRQIFFGVQGFVFAHGNDTKIRAASHCTIRLIAFKYGYL